MIYFDVETRTEGDLGAWETLRGACGAAEGKF